MQKIYLTVLSLFTGSLLLAQSGSQVFTSSGIFPVPSGTYPVTIEVVGAGGSGASNGGGGGGGGGYAKAVFNVTNGSGNWAVTVGTGGGGPVNGATSIGPFVSASGGANATTVSNPNVGGGGAGGTGSGTQTTITRSGGNGGGGYYTYFGGGGGGAAGSISNGGIGGNTIVYSTGNCLTPGGAAGIGGGAPGGDGGKGAGFTNNSCSATNPAAGGLNYGGGGGGGNGIGSPVGVGAGGYCIITWGCTAPSSPTNITAAANMSVCSGQTTLTVASDGGVTWYNTPNGTGSIGTGTTFVTPVLAMTTTFYAEATTCTNSIARTPVTVTVLPTPTVGIQTTSNTICQGQSAVLNANGASGYTWSPFVPSVMSQSVGANITVTPQASGPFIVTGAASNGCTSSATLVIFVNPTPTVIVTATSGTICAGQTTTLNYSGSNITGYFWSPAATTNTILPMGVALKPLVTTIYTVGGISAAGCLGTTTVPIMVLPSPNITLTPLRNPICKFETTTINASGASTYTWNSASSGSSIVTPATLISNFNYSVSATQANGCSQMAIVTISVQTCLGINGTEINENKLSVFPNPSTGNFSISSDRNLEVDIINETGQIIRSLSLNKSNSYMIETKQLSAGIYFIVSRDKNNPVTKKVIVAAD